MVSAWTSGRTRDEALAACDVGQVPAGPVYAIDEIFEDPQYAARENMVEMTDPRIGTLKVPNVVPRLSETPGGVDSLGPSLGQHNEEVYCGLLGIDEARLRDLAESGVV